MNILNYYQVKQAEIDPVLLATGLASLVGGTAGGAAGYFGTEDEPTIYYDKDTDSLVLRKESPTKNALMSAIMSALLSGGLTAGIGYGRRLVG